MKSKKALWGMAVACCIAWPVMTLAEAGAPATAHADPQVGDVAPNVSIVPSSAAVSAANELMQLQEQTLLLKAQLKKLDAQAQVKEREASIDRMGGPVSYGNVSVLATQSLGKTTSATVAMGDGAQLDVQPGDVLPNGMRVISIRSGGVVVAQPDGHRQTLNVSSQWEQASHSPAANAPGFSGGVPPIPALPMPSR